MITVDIWQLLGVLGTLMGMMLSIMIAASKALIKQFEKRLDEKFSSMDASRSAAQQHWDNQFASLEKAAIDEAKGWQRLEREMMQMKVDLPKDYVRRDDYVRNQSVIESKIDGLAIRIENALLRNNNG